MLMRSLAPSLRSPLYRTLVVVALAGLSSGCFLSRSKANPAIDPIAVASIVPGRSTADDVTRLLGAPNEVVQLGRKSAWRYEHTIQKEATAFLLLLGLQGSDTQADRVWVFFDEASNVTHLGSLLQAGEAKYDIPVF